MKSVNSIYLDKHKKFRLDSKKLATVFVISSFIVAIIVFWWLKLVGITVTGEAFCGLSEHTHGDECYVSELICGFDETETGTLPEESATTEVTTEISDTATSETDETVSKKADKETENTDKEAETVTTAEITTAITVHTHTDDCYSKALSCKTPEHVHIQKCFPDKTADVETVSDWLSTLEDVEITNDISENLVAVAMSQIGYEESKNNFEFTSDGSRNGYTRYGEWYGNPYGKWNAMFVSFCLHYSNINNEAELKAAGAEALRLAWQNRGVYSPKSEYGPERGDLVFLDKDGDSVTDTVGVVLSVSEKGIVAVMGDSNDKVESVSIDATDSIIGYGSTGKLSFAKDKEFEAEGGETTTEAEEKAEEKAAPLMLYSTPRAKITYINDLTTVVKAVNFKTTDGDIIGPDSTVYLGQTYVISMEFAEKNTGDEWIQFQHDEDHHLHYQIPENIHCEPFTEWHPITAKTENGTIEDVGEYFIRDDGLLIVVFHDDPVTGECFGAKYSNVDFTIEFNATVGSIQSDEKEEIVFNDKISVNLNIDGGAGMTVNKTHGSYDSDNHTMEYTVRVEATNGVVKDLVIDDQIWENHYALRDTIVVTDLDGNILDPQPTVSNHPSHNSGANEGFRLSGFPDFSAGNGFLITYKTKVYDEMIYNDTVDMWNGLDSLGKDSKGSDVYVWTDDWLRVELEKMEKDGKQAVLEDAQGNPVPVIEWAVEIKKDNHNLQGTVIIDTLGDGLKYYTGKDIRIKHYDEAGNRLDDAYISWDNVTVNGNTMSFPLPDGYSFEIIYYTTYEELDEGEKKNYTNRVSATINGREETAGGNADVVGFVPRVRKSASGNDGEYVYFTIEADVPAVIKDWGNFFLTDLSAFWGYNNEVGYLYVENVPEDLNVTAVTKSGSTVTFTPYTEGGPTENTFILVSPAEGKQYHSFNLLFNTSSTDFPSSKWILDEDSVLTVTYKLPFDSKTGIEWEGELTGDKTLEDVLLEGGTFANEAYLNYTDVIQGTGSSTYQYSPTITKNSSVNDDGTIDYTVVFNSTIPGSGGNQGYLTSAQSIIFSDTFDEKLEYVEDSLTVTCFDPWNSSSWYNKYKHDGKISGNIMNVQGDSLKLYETNSALPQNTINWIRPMHNYQVYCNSIGAGGTHVFTYTLRLKDEYLNTTEENKFVLDNTAEIKWDGDKTSGPASDTAEYRTGLLDKHVVQENNRLLFDIHVNRNALDILKGTDTITIEDTMTHNLSVYWDTIKLYYEDTDGSWVDFDSENSRYKYTVTYDQVSNRLTFVLPDELHIRIDYTTLITESGHISVNNAVKVEGKARVSDILDATFKVEDHSGGATGSIHNITLLKQDGDTDDRLPDVGFLLYGPMGDPKAVPPDGADESIVTDYGKNLYYIGLYSTGADGTVNIETQYLTFGGPYALVETAPPEGYMKLSKPVYFYFYEPDPDGIIQTVTTLIAVENYTYGFVLPETGGTGTLPLAIIGVALMAFPILYSTIRRKRERRLTQSPDI